MTVTRKGDWTQLHLQPGYPKFRENATALVIELLYEGDYNLIQARKPGIGNLYPGYGKLYVDDVFVDKLAAGKGSLRVTLTNQGSDTPGGKDEKPVREVYWMDLVRSIEQHPRYKSPGGVKELGIAERMNIQLWKAETDFEAKTHFKYYEIGENGRRGALKPIGTHAEDLATELLLGNDSYTTTYCVAMETTHHRGTFKLSPCPRRVSAKPFDACPDNYFWIRWNDRLTRTGKRGKWQRTVYHYGYEEEINGKFYKDEAGKYAEEEA